MPFCFSSHAWLCRAKMKTNGSQCSHIQVDRQTIETALDDEVEASFPNSNEGKTNAASRVKRRKPNGKTRQMEAVQPAESEDLLDILDNFLITTSNAAAAATPEHFSSHPRSESITNVSSPAHQQLTLPTRFVKKGNKIGVTLN